MAAVAAAVNELQASGKKVSKAAVARVAGVSRATLYANPTLRALVEAAAA